MSTLTQPVSPPAPSLPLETASARLISLDVFRGMVIVAMLVVNNVADYAVAGYWWKHANWIEPTQAAAYRLWWAGISDAGGFLALLGHIAYLPLFQHVTLADFVMPWFILIIGVAIPFSTAAARRRGMTSRQMWVHVLRRSFTLVLLGWAIDASLRVQGWHHSANPEAALGFTLGMNVLQLLGLSYLVARVICLLPMTPRLAVAAAMFIGHWALLRFFPQPLTETGGGMGAFTAQHNALSYIYANWAIFQPIEITQRLNVSLRGVFSIVPAAATMVLGTWMGQVLLRGDIGHREKASRLALAGAALAAAGFLWAFDLTFNKPVWTSSYLLYTSGVAAVLLAGLHVLVDIRNSRWWVRPFVVFGLNSIAAYWLSIMFKIWILNMPKVSDGEGGTMMLTRAIVLWLQEQLGRPAGAWAFTILFVCFWWLVFEMAYRRRMFWKL